MADVSGHSAASASRKRQWADAEGGSETMTTAEYGRMLSEAGMGAVTPWEDSVEEFVDLVSAPSAFSEPSALSVFVGDETPGFSRGFGEETPLLAGFGRQNHRTVVSETPMSMISDATPALPARPCVAPPRRALPPVPTAPATSFSGRSELQEQHTSHASPALPLAPNNASPAPHLARFLVGEGTPMEMTVDMSRFIAQTPAEAKGPSTPGRSEAGFTGFGVSGFRVSGF